MMGEVEVDTMLIGSQLGRVLGGVGLGVGTHMLPPISALLWVSSPVSLHGLSGSSMSLGPRMSNIIIILSFSTKVCYCQQEYAEILTRLLSEVQVVLEY